MKKKFDLGVLENLTDKELIDIAYIKAANAETPKDTGDLLIALVKRIVDNKHDREALSAILPGLKVITDCVEKTLEGDLDVN